MCNCYYFRKLILLLVFVSFSNLSLLDAAVKAPNYDFKLEQLSIFYPGKSKDELDKKFGEGQYIFKNNKLAGYRYYVSEQNYRFPVYVQIKDNLVTDFHTSLPIYFLHDVFHQSLITKYGLQNNFLNHNEQSIYLWNKRDDIQIVYASACTITCFPLYLSVMPAKAKWESGYKPIIELLKGQLDSESD